MCEVLFKISFSLTTAQKIEPRYNVRSSCRRPIGERNIGSTDARNVTRTCKTVIFVIKFGLRTQLATLLPVSTLQRNIRTLLRGRYDHECRRIARSYEICEGQPAAVWVRDTFLQNRMPYCDAPWLDACDAPCRTEQQTLYLTGPMQATARQLKPPAAFSLRATAQPFVPRSAQQAHILPADAQSGTDLHQ